MINRLRIALVSLAACAPFSCAASSFVDVPDSHPYANGIGYLKLYGMAEGNPDGTFRPDQTINRAEFTKLVTGVGFNSSETLAACQSDRFPDVKKGQWFFPYVCVAAEKGIVGGYPDGRFRPEQTISFAEAAKILTRVMLGDVQVTEPWYEVYAKWLSDKDAIPLSITAFDQPITRGEMAEMLSRTKEARGENRRSQTYEQLVSGPGTAMRSLQRLLDTDDMQEYAWEDPYYGGYSISYPSSWTAKPDPNVLAGYVNFEAPEAPLFSGVNHIDSANMQIYISQECPTKDNPNVRNITIDGMRFLERDESDAYGEYQNHTVIRTSVFQVPTFPGPLCFVVITQAEFYKPREGSSEDGVERKQVEELTSLFDTMMDSLEISRQ